MNATGSLAFRAVLCLFAAWCTACGHSAGEPPTASDDKGAIAMNDSKSRSGESSRTPGRVPSDNAARDAATGHAVPESLIDAMRTDLARRKNLSKARIDVNTAQPVTWRNGSMGCPEKGMAYTQALIPGYRVVLRSGDTDYAYHADSHGRFQYCENPASEGIAPPGAGGTELQ